MQMSDPAAQFVFSPEATDFCLRRPDGSLYALRLKIENGMVFIKPVEPTDQDPDVIRLTNRDTHADCYANIDTHATGSAHLLDTLRRGGLSFEEPYFRLTPMDRGWIVLTHVMRRDVPAVSLKIVPWGLLTQGLSVLETACAAIQADPNNTPNALLSRLVTLARSINNLTGFDFVRPHEITIDLVREAIESDPSLRNLA